MSTNLEVSRFYKELLFPTLLCGVLVFLLHLLARPPPPPPSSFLLSSSLPTTSSLTHTSSHTQHHSHNISHNNISHTTSHTHNISHTTSDPHTHLSQQHLSQQHHSDNIPHTTSRIQHHSHNIFKGSDNNISTHISHNNITQRTSHTQHLTHNSSTHQLLAKGSDAKGSDVRPGVVWRRLGTGADFVAGAALCCLPRGSDVPPGVVWRRLGTGADFVAGAALCCLPRGRMYALASSGVGWAPAQISWQAQHFAACEGVGCTPWRRLASAGHRRRFRGRRSTLLLAKGSDVRPGVVWRRLGTGADFVAGAALCCLPRGRMYALASSGVGWAPAQISWQAQHFAACQGVGCTPWRRLASVGHRRRFRGRRSTLLLAKGSDVRPGVVWRRLGTGADFVAGAALCCLPRGRMYAGVVWRRLGTGADFVAGAALCCLPRGRMYALASSGVGWAPAQISWQAQHFAACQGVGCTPWRRLASAGHRRRFRGRHSTL